MEESRQVMLANAKTAVEEWQASVGTLLQPEGGQPFASGLDAWSKLFVSPFNAKGASDAEPAAKPAAAARKATTPAA